MLWRNSLYLLFVCETAIASACMTELDLILTANSNPASVHRSTPMKARVHEYPLTSESIQLEQSYALILSAWLRSVPSHILLKLSDRESLYQWYSQESSCLLLAQANKFSGNQSKKAQDAGVLTISRFDIGNKKNWHQSSEPLGADLIVRWLKHNNFSQFSANSNPILSHCDVANLQSACIAVFRLGKSPLNSIKRSSLSVWLSARGWQLANEQNSFGQQDTSHWLSAVNGLKHLQVGYLFYDHVAYLIALEQKVAR